MNTAALKSFAPAVRRQLMEAVRQKLDFVLSARTPDYLTTFARQVGELRKLAQTDRPGLVERVAYTWFNRFAALRYLDAKGWHPFRVRVLTPANPEETQPEILKLARISSLPEELRPHVKAGLARLKDLFDGRIPSADPQGEVYRHLVLAACHFYHVLLPDLFERLDDETELLLPDDLLTEQSVVQGFRTEITDSDCAEVEVLGWLYQFYISEKKDTVMGRKAAVPTEDIPAVTQLFTPHWIVRYLVENSLGRLWLLNRPVSRLREQMPYYIEGEPEADFLRIANPKEIRLLDPAVGSGHMLTYAFELLYAIYEEEGFAPLEIPALILTHNLHGVDICPRATQLAALALVLKAREKSRRFLQTDKFVTPRISCMEDVRFGNNELRDYVEALDLGDLFSGPAKDLLCQFENAATFGSLIQPRLDQDGIGFIKSTIAARDVGGQLFLNDTHIKVLRVLAQSEHLSSRYHVVVANPPYMGSGNMNSALKLFAGRNYPVTKSDLLAMFVERGLQLVRLDGYIAFVTLQNWMFLSSFATMREDLILNQRILSCIQIGYNSFPELNSKVAQAVALVIRKSPHDEKAGHYFDLNSAPQSADKEQVFLDHRSIGRSYCVNNSQLRLIPGSPLAYWISQSLRATFKARKLGELTWGEGKNITSNNDRFLRLLWEVSRGTIGRGRKWLIYAKGGPYRKWAGNLEYVCDWGPQALAFYRRNSSSRLIDEQYWYRPGITWTVIATSGVGFRYLPSDTTFDTKGLALFFRDERDLLPLLGLLNSAVVQKVLPTINPTFCINTIDVKAVPVPFGIATAEGHVQSMVELATADWNTSEVSLEFSELPLLRLGMKDITLQASWTKWKSHCDAALRRMQELETENNRLFINAYDLQHELKAEVAEHQITLARADPRRDMAAFLSYAVGCMMGRFSLERPGLALANAGDTLEHYFSIVGKPKEELHFIPGEDGIIPFLDGEWFEDDIVARAREFLRATFGEATLRENVRFIEESLGKDLRKYFLTDFYKDHLQTYKKRPIYWLVQSPRKGFSVLIYLHRYTRDTMNLVLNRYLRDYQVKLRNRAEHLAGLLASEGSTREKTEGRREADKISKTLHECEEWERRTVLPLAQARIELNLDDGVKVNYLKLGEALAPVVGMESKGEE